MSQMSEKLAKLSKEQFSDLAKQVDAERANRRSNSEQAEFERKVNRMSNQELSDFIYDCDRERSRKNG